MKHNRKKLSNGKLRKTSDYRQMVASRFRVFCSDSGMSIDEIAKSLHVTPRTVRYWLSGEALVPYSAYRLLRIQRMFELPMPGWKGWHMHSGKLWTPEGFPIEPTDGSWWSLLVRQARCFRTMYYRAGEFERALMRLATTANSPVDVAVQSGGISSTEPPPGSLNLAIAEAAPSGERLAAAAGVESASPGQRPGRREAPLDLSLGHFGTGISQNAPLSRGNV